MFKNKCVIYWNKNIFVLLIQKYYINNLKEWHKSLFILFTLLRCFTIFLTNLQMCGVCLNQLLAFIMYLFYKLASHKTRCSRFIRSVINAKLWIFLKQVSSSLWKVESYVVNSNSNKWQSSKRLKNIFYFTKSN